MEGRPFRHRGPGPMPRKDNPPAEIPGLRLRPIISPAMRDGALIALVAAVMVFALWRGPTSASPTPLTGHSVQTMGAAVGSEPAALVDRIDLSGDADAQRPGIEHLWRPSHPCAAPPCALKSVRLSGLVLANQTGNLTLALKTGGRALIVADEKFVVSRASEGLAVLLTPPIVPPGEPPSDLEAASHGAPTPQPHTVYRACHETCALPLEWDVEAPFALSADLSAGLFLGQIDLIYEWHRPPGGAGNSDFELVGTYREVEAPLLYPGTGSFSAAAWIRTAEAEDAVIVSSGECCGIERYWSLGMSRTGPSAVLLVRLNDGRGEIFGTGKTNLADGRWHHVVLVRNARDRIVFGYVDGAPELGMDDPTAGISDASTVLLVGAANVFQDEFFRGEVRSVQTTSDALTSERISALHRQGPPDQQALP